MSFLLQKEYPCKCSFNSFIAEIILLIFKLLVNCSIYHVRRSDCDDFRSHLLQNIAKCVLKRSDLQKESTVVEFMACDHNSHCGALHQVSQYH